MITWSGKARVNRENADKNNTFLNLTPEKGLKGRRAFLSLHSKNINCERYCDKNRQRIEF